MIIRVIAAVVDVQQVVLYKEDASTLIIPQGDPRIRRIIDEVLPIVQTGGIAEVNLEMPTLETYKDFEEKTNGVVKFWRVLKKSVKDLFVEPTEEETVAPTGEFGSIPTEEVDPAPKPTMEEAVNEIMAQAQPISDPEFKEADTTEEHTIIAQVDGKIIPGAENLKDQLAYSVKGNSTIGMENFMKRIAAVIEKRSHSVQDLLRFMERGDLPVANDGSIIAYKILKKKRGAPEGTFVDCHTGRVPQKVGSYVRVDENLVDRDRTNECSNGLHIARRGYLGSFGGDVCTLVKVAPEDVVTVPHRDANKVRVCGYHIIGLLDDDSFRKLKANRPMTDNPLVAKMLGKAIAGDHIRKVEEVLITEQRGGGIKLSPIGKDGQVQRKVESAPAHAFDDDKALTVAPKEVEKAVVAATELSRGDKAKALRAKMIDTNLSSEVRLAAGNELLTLKKNTKVGWDKLGVNGDEVAMTMARLAPVSPVAEPVKAPAPAPKIDAVKVAATITDKAKQPMPERGKPKAKATPAKVEPKAPEAKPKVSKGNDKQPVQAEPQVLTRVERARKFFDDKDIKGLKQFKQKAKVSWSSLGFTKAEVAIILKG